MSGGATATNVNKPVVPVAECVFKRLEPLLLRCPLVATHIPEDAAPLNAKSGDAVMT